MRRLLIALAALLFSGACVLNVGPRAERLTVATSPSGTIADIRVRDHGELFTGELLEVRDTALVVLSGGRVTVVPVSAIRRVTFRDSAIYLDGGDVFGVGELSELRLLSRFPQGITPPLMSALLAALGQTEPRLLAP